MKPQAHQPVAIQSADITELARLGRERALAARQAVAELTPEQAAAVGGGAIYLTDSFPWGVLPFVKVSDMFKNPADHTLDAGALAGRSF